MGVGLRRLGDSADDKATDTDSNYENGSGNDVNRPSTNRHSSIVGIRIG